ncbi:hypothetical protein [Leisingera aquimarina]|uniref:hypothetical protein n=1 Tax=Leisingera aquimarina TaxID=476529 RepID=UPI00146F9D16|nr:hypothetical protein [Leisingera aquimarina]
MAFDLDFDQVIGIAVRALQDVIAFGIHLPAGRFAIDISVLAAPIIRALILNQNQLIS